jgi:DNA-binding GntR family transcriptional regulator
MTGKVAKKTMFQAEVEKSLRALRNEIYSGLRLPRERLVENALSETFSVSRMVIRQVLSQLESEGLVEIEPYKGATVAAFSLGRLRESYQILSMLEGFAAMQTAERISPKELDKLRQLVREQRPLEAANVRQWQMLNQRFHRTINLRCGNEKLIGMIRQHVQFTTYWFLLLSVPGRIPKNIEEHEAVIEAISRGDALETRRLMEHHIMGAGEDLMAHLQETMPIGFLQEGR